MIKRLLVLVALAVTVLACNPSDGGGSPGTESVAPIESMPAASPSS
jgi:hypothetical protein